MTRSIDDAFINAYRPEHVAKDAWSAQSSRAAYRPKRVSLKQGFLAAVLGGQEWYVDERLRQSEEAAANQAAAQQASAAATSQYAQGASELAWYDGASILAMPSVELVMHPLMQAQPAAAKAIMAAEEKAKLAATERAAQEQAQLAARAEAERAAQEQAQMAARAAAERAAEKQARLAARAEAVRVAQEQAQMAARAEAVRVAQEQAQMAARAEAVRAAEEQARQAARAAAERDAEEQARLAARAEAARAAREQAQRDADPANEAGARTGPQILRIDAAAPMPPTPFSAEWEVDRFHWPDVCEQLKITREDSLREAGDQLTAAAAEGLTTLVVTSACRGEGRSTLALCLSRAATESGLRVAVVDADLDHPSLADKLNVRLQQDWRNSAFEGGRLEDAAISSLEDRLTLVPLMAGHESLGYSLSDPRVAEMLSTLASEFDLVVVDAGPLALAHKLLTGDSARLIDAVIVVRDQRSTTNEEVDRCVRAVRELGVQAVGIAENFGPLAPAA